MEERIRILEENVKRLTDLVNSLIKSINISKEYTDADIAGTRKSVNDLTPYKATKEAYYADREVTFYDVPEGNVSVFFDYYYGPYTIERISNMLVVKFDSLINSTNVTIVIQ